MAEPARQQSLDERATVAVSSRRFGDYTFALDRVLHFPEGLIGFPAARRFALLESARPGGLFHVLHCLDLPELGFVVCDPGLFWSGYTADLPRPDDLASEDMAVLAIVTVPQNPVEMTANLMAPLLINLRTRIGVQIVLDTGRYSTRHPVLPPAQQPPASK